MIQQASHLVWAALGAMQDAAGDAADPGASGLTFAIAGYVVGLALLLGYGARVWWQRRALSVSAGAPAAGGAGEAA